MFERYRAQIEAYCEALGIEIPVGFRRHDAGRYAAIDLESSPHKLVATTWSHEPDAIQYLLNLGEGHSVRILDFKDRCERTFHGGSILRPGDPF